MKKGHLLVALMMVIGATGIGFAADGDSALTTTVDITWVSQYIWRGFDVFDDAGAVQPSIDIAVGDTGLSFNIWSSHADTSGRADVDHEWDYTIAYGTSFAEGEVGQVDFSLWYTYFDYPVAYTKDSDMAEIGATISMPNLLECGLVPSYSWIQMWDAKSGGANEGSSGDIHIFGLGYTVECQDSGQALDLGWDIVYNDGAGAGGIDHDWSHMVWSASTSFDLGMGSFTPAVYYQNSFEDTVNTEDELWVSLSYGISF